MQKLNRGRGRLLLSTCLSGVALAWAPGAQAQAQDKAPTWKPRAEVDARAADGSSQVSFELFAPVAQNDSNLLFVAGRIGTDERYDRNGSVTIGGRGKIGEDVAIGVNAGVDFYKTDITSRDQTAVSFGLEGFTSVFDLHVNYRLPVNNRRTIGYLDPNASPAGTLSVENNRLIERKSGWRLEEVPLAGANAEIGATAALSKDLSLRGSLSGFDYRDDAASKAYRGVRGGLELGIEDPLGTGGRFSVGAELQNDNRWGTQARGTVRLSIPIGRGARDRSAGTSGLDRQMGERLRRDYVTPSGTRYTDLTSTGFAIDARTGVAFGGVYFTSGSGTAGAAGTSTATTTLSDAVTRAGANGIVVALGNAGTIASGGVTLAANQYLVGGASSVSVRHSDGSVSAFSFGGTNGTITGSNAGGAAITLGQGSVVRDVTVRGAGSGILANGVGGFALERVVIENTGAAGLTLTNTTGSVVVDGLTVRGGAGAGVVINGGSNVTLRNSIIGGGAGAIDINDAGGNLTTTLSSLTLSATGGTVLDIDGSGAGTVTVAGLSGINITGGNGETGGFAARNVTFDASATAGIQAVNAGAMQVGTTTARVGGAGVTLTDVDGALSFANLNIANNGGTGLRVNNTKTGTFTLSTAAGTTDTTAGAALNLDPLLIDLTFSSVRSTGAAGAAILLDNVQGAGTGGNALTIGTLTILNSGQQGLFITGGSTGLVTIGGGSITNSGGASVQVGESGVAGSGGTIGLNFGATITDTGAGPLVSLFNTGGAIRFTGAISGAGPITIGGTAAGSSVTFAGATTITGSTSPVLSIDNAAGGVAFTGLLTIANPAGTGIVIGNVPGGVTFGDVDITGLGAGTGVNFTGTHGNVTFGTLDITGTGATGSTGIDLTGATNAGAITITNPSVIQGVDIGANLTNAAITGSFRFGDGNAADGLESRITANTVIVVAGMNATQGTYDFAEVDLDGNTNNITGGSFTAYYVLAGASGAGTANDPGSIAGAAASGAQYIVLLNNPNGGQDVIDTSGLSGGALNLSAGQSLVSFLNSDFFAVTGATVPANLIVSNLGPTGITNTYTGSGAAVLTSSTGGSTVVLANNTTLDGVIVHNDAAGIAVVGTGVSNVIIRNSTVSGTGGAISIFDSINAASVTLSNVDLSASSGTVLALNGAGGGTLNVSGTDVSITATGTAQGANLFDVNLGALDISSITTGTSGTSAVALSGLTGGTLNIGSIAVGGVAAGVGVDIRYNAATVNIGSLTVADAGTGLSVWNNSGTLNIGPVSITNAGSQGVSITSNSGAITLGATTVSGSGNNAVMLADNGGTIAFGALALSDAGGAGLAIYDNSGSVTAAGGSIVNMGRSGVLIDGVTSTGSVTIGAIGVTDSTEFGISLRGIEGTVNFTGTTSIANSSGIGLAVGNTGAISFGDVDITGLGDGLVGLDARASSGNVTFATLDITGTSTNGTRGIDLTGASFAGNLIVSGSSTITGVAIGVDLTNAAITGNFRFGDGSSTDANGAGSTISATTPIVIAGLNAITGIYDFADVNLTGDTSSLSTSASVYWVLAGATGAGTKADPGNLAGAAASGADVIILINNPAGGNDTIDANEAVYGSGGTFTLLDGQQLRGFLNGDTITLPGGAPANLRLYNIAAGVVTNPFAGSGAPTLTTTRGGGADTVRVTGNNLIDGVIIANGGTGSGVLGVGAASVTIRNSNISGADSSIDFRDGGLATSIALSNLHLWSSNGSINLAVYRSGAGSTTITQLSNVVLEGGHGEAGGAYFYGATFDSDLATAGYQNVDASLQVGTATARSAGVGLNLITATGSLNFSSLSIYNQGNTGVAINSAGLNLTSTAGTVDSLNGTTLSLVDSEIDLVLDSIVHSGAGYGIISTGTLTGLGTGGRALQVGVLNSTGGTNGIAISGTANGTVSVGAGSSISGTSGAAIALGSGAGTLDFTYNGSVTQGANFALLNVTDHNGTITFGAGSTLSATNGTGLQFTNADGSYAFNGTTTLNGGDAGIDIMGGSAGSFTFGAGTVITNPSGPGFSIANSTAGVTYLGTLSQSNAGVLALAVSTHSGGALDFTGATLNVTGGFGLAFNDADGTYSFGNLALSGGAGLAIVNGSAGNFTFGDVDIIGLAANTTAANLTGATGNVTFATLDITGASNTGTRGIDLTGSTTAGNIIISGSSTITGVGVGVDLTNAAITGNFRFGDGSGTDANGAASSITAVTPLVIAGLNGGVGTYDFLDVNLNGDTTNLSVSAYFVQEGATGIGTWNDPGSLAGAEASGATYIVLLNDLNGGSDTLDATAGAGGSLDLAGGQVLLAFRDVDRFTVGGGAPINVKLFNVQTGEIVNPFTGSGAPTLTASGANATVTLAGNNTIDGVVIANSGTGAGVLGNGVAGINTIRNSTISGGAAGAIRFYDNAANTVVALQNLTLAANGGNILALDGTGAGTLTVSALSNLTALHTTETGGFVFADVTFDADTVTAGVQDVAAGDLALGTVAARINGTALTFSNVSGTLNFGNLNIANDGGTGLIVANSKVNNFVLGTTGGAIDTTNGTAINIDPLTVNMTLGSVKSSGGVYGLLLDQVQGSFTVTGIVDVSNASDTAIAIRDNTGAAFAAKFQGAVTISGTTGAGVSLTNNTGATIDFTGGLGITTTSGTGFSANTGTVVVLGAGNTIATTTGQVLSLSGVTSGSGGITFDSLTASGTVANNGILLSNLTGAAFNGGTVNIGGTSGAANDGIKVTTGTAAITFGDTTIGTASSNAIELLNSGSAVTFGNMTLSGAGSSTVVIAGSTGAVTLGTGTITATGAANYAVSVTGGTGDVTVGSALGGTNLVQIVDHETGTVTFSGDMASTVSGISVTNVNSGLITFTGQTLALNATSAGVTLAGNSGGTIDFNPTNGGSGLDIVSTGTGFTAGSGGTIIVRGNGNSISTTGTGTALSLQNVTIGTDGFTFGSVTANGATTGILLNGVGTATPAISLGTVNLQGITSRGIDVTGILSSGLTIADLDIGLNSNSAVALDLNGAAVSGNIAIGNFDVTNSGGAGTSIGVDLRGTTGGASIQLGGQAGASSSISGVGTGIYLNAATNALVTYGDGEAGTDTGSTISATTAINASAAPTVGTYDFRDVAFSGSPGSGFGLNKIYFVDSDGATGGGDGSGSDGFNPMTLAAAELAAANEDIIVLVNNGSAISAAGSNGNNSLVLAPNAQVRGFGNGSDGGAGTGSAPIVITLTVPSTILLSGGGSVSIADPTVTGGAATLTSSAGSNVITLAALGNHLSGFILDGGGGASRGIKDNGAGATNTLIDYLTVRNFGTMGIEITPSISTTIDHVSFSGNPGGDVLLNAANSVLTNITSNGGGITLNNATGTTTLTNVDLAGGAGLVFTNAAGTINATNVDITNPVAAGLTISGGTASFNFDLDSSVTKSSAGASLSIGGGHSGGTFVYAGTLNITGGTGLQFDNADGTYNFTGTTALAGGNAGIDILNGSGGTFSFGTNTAITSPLGTAFNVSDSTAAITYSGSITQTNNAALVSFLNHSGGTVTFQTGTLSATNGTGLQFDNADGTYNFTGTTTLNGGDAGIDIVNGSAGTFGFGTGASITHAAAGDAFVLTDSNATLTYSGDIDDSNGHAVRIDNHDAGNILFQTGTISSSGANALGISLSNSNGGAIRFTGQTTLSTDANNALVLSANAGGTIEFSPTDTPQSLFITTTSGTAITMSGGGIFNVFRNNNSFNRIATGSGTLFDISNATAATTTLNLGFVDARNTAAASPTNGILISRTAGTLNGSIDITTGAITATNRGIDVDGGSLSLTYKGTIATSGSTARSVEITNMAGGAVTLEGNLTDTALGINVSNNSSGFVAFYGQTIALTPVANQTAVTLSNNGTTSISFSSTAGGNGFDIVASGTGKGIDFTGGGSLLVYGPGSTITTQNGQILNLVNGNANSARGINFDSLTSTGTVAGNAINVSNIDGGTFQATNVSIAGTTGAAADGIFYGGGSTMNVDLGTVTIGNTGGDGIEVNGANNGTFAATSVAISNTGGNGVEINGSTNSVTLAGGSISGTTGYGVHVLGGTGAVSLVSSITKTSSGNVVFVDGHSGGNLSFSGNISATGGFDNGILVQNVGSGSVTFSGTKTLNTGANTAVRLVNNSGTINFLNGGLAITTTSGAGFYSTAGVPTGTVTVEGTGNTISSGTGTALTIVNNNIGANNVTFQSISSNGATNGILLNTTGSSGGLRVTGTGAAGSGGAIQNATGDGISLTGTEDVRLAYMTLKNNRGNGIGGSNVNGFLIDNLLIEENGTDNGTDESGINLVNLSGSVSGGARPTGIFNSTIKNNNEFEVQISNSSGTLTNFQVVSSTFSANGATINGGSGPHGNLFNFLGTGTSTMGISVSGSSFTGAASVLGSGLFIDSSGTSMSANITGSTFTNNNNGINISTGPGSTTLTYRIDGNTITGSRSTAINDFQNGNGPFTRTVEGTITNNIIGTAGVAQSGSTNGNGISISNEGAVNAKYLIDGNTIQQIGTSGGLGGAGISVITGLFGVEVGTQTTQVTIRNNTISNILNDSGISIINAQNNVGTKPKIAASLSGNGFVNTYNNQNIYLESSNGGEVLVREQAASASANSDELDDKNGGNDPSKIVTSGTITYGQAIPDLPGAPVLP